MIIKTKQFILRPFKKSDASDYSRYGNNKKITINMRRMPFPFTLNDAQVRVKRIMAESKKKKPAFITLAIEIDGEMVGWISANTFEGHKCSIGYWLAEKYWGNGIMTNIVKVFIREIFKKFKLKRIEAYVYHPNIGSMRVLEKCGFIKEGVLKKYCFKGNKYFDSHVYAKIK